MNETTRLDRAMNTNARQSRWSALGKGLRQAGLGAVLVGAALGSVLAADTRRAAGASVKSDRIEVGYRDPAKLSEIELYPRGGTEFIDALSKYLLAEAERVLPAGQRLSVTITDVLLAGRFEPWRPGRLSDVRIVKDTTPPRIDLTFRLESAQGAVLKEGERKLRDSNFLSRPRHRGETLGYEKNLIDDWLRKEVRPARR